MGILRNIGRMLAFALGVSLVVITSTRAPGADEKGEPIRTLEPPAGAKEHERFPETVVIREWSERDNAFVAPVRTRAVFGAVQGKPVICVWDGFGPIAVGSTIEHHGLVYTVTASGETITCQRCYVAMRPRVEKKL